MEKYGLGKKDLLKACFARELLLMKRTSYVYISKLIQVNSSPALFVYH